ncbi:MAG: neutral zinc metallopeptidase [Acidimicrobiia bacterium]|nr:neutral zinc metallopeptidase [Acidimicrobiia bacterium]
MGIRGRRRRSRAGALVVVGVMAACGGSAEEALVAAGRGDVDRTDNDRRDQETEVDIEDFEEVEPDDQDDAVIEAALAEVETFWENVFPEVYGGEFTPVQGGFFPYGPDREPVPCGSPPPSYEEVAGNAFYCPGVDLIAWDTDNLTNQLLDTFGPFSLVIVMAHEYAHAIQVRAEVDPRLPTIATEQQADCFAGAFTGFLADGGSDVLSVSEDDLDAAVAGFLTLRDQVGTPADDPAAHGSAFDRVGAFQDGFDQGAGRCAEYERIYVSGDSTVVDIPFLSQADFDAGGNAPFDPAVEGNIFDLALTSLESYWSQALPAQFGEELISLSPGRVQPYFPSEESTLPACEGEDIDAERAEELGAFVCDGDPEDLADDFIAWDQENLMPTLYEEPLGDFAVASVIARLYSQAVQLQLGTAGDDPAAGLQADCFTGTWAAALAFPDRVPESVGVQISPGDLDEAVGAFLTLDTGEEDQATAFERVAAFRSGFFDDLAGCELDAEPADG